MLQVAKTGQPLVPSFTGSEQYAKIIKSENLKFDEILAFNGVNGGGYVLP